MGDGFGLGFGDEICICAWLGYGVLGLCGWESGAWDGIGMIRFRWCFMFCYCIVIVCMVL